MTTDISSALQRALAKGKTWTSVQVRQVLSTLVGPPGSSRAPDWDEDAGELWGRVVDHQGVVALVSARIPLVIVRASAVRQDEISSDHLEIVWVRSIDAAELRADFDTLCRAFPELSQVLADDASAFSPGRFAAEELWFLTA